MKRLLIVDDDRNLLHGLRRAFRGQQLNVFEATSAEEAKQAFLCREFDLAIIDYLMPNENGVDLCEWIATEHPETPRILLTGNANVRVAQDAINRGHISRLLLKPISNSQLMATINNILEETPV